MMEMDKDTVLIFVNIMLTVAGGVVAFFTARLTSVIKELKQADKDLDAKITLHREDTLKNYVTTADLLMMKADLIARIDRFEESLLTAIRTRV